MNTIITENDFINEIQQNPNSNSILIFADFLEESGKGNKSNFLRNVIKHPNNPEKYCNFEIFKNDYWKTIRHCDLTKNQLILFSIQNAESVLPIFEKEFPNDNRPRNAIEVAKSSEDKNELKNAADDAYSAARSAARSAADAAYSAARSAADAAYSAAYYAADAAYSANSAAAYSANSAAAYSAADAVNAADFANREPFKIWQFIRIMEYKLFDSNELVSLLHKPEIK